MLKLKTNTHAQRSLQQRCSPIYILIVVI